MTKVSADSINSLIEELKSFGDPTAGLGGRMPPPEPPLNYLWEGSKFPEMDPVDAKIAAAEARTDTKFAELRGDLSRFATTSSVWAAAGTAAATILGVLLAVMAFGGDRFDAGVSAGAALAPYAEQQRQRDAKQDDADALRDRQFEEILKRLPPPKK